eukprot:3076620-Rhodomonas_salina.2
MRSLLNHHSTASCMSTALRHVRLQLAQRLRVRLHRLRHSALQIRIVREPVRRLLPVLFHNPHALPLNPLDHPAVHFPEQRRGVRVAPHLSDQRAQQREEELLAARAVLGERQELELEMVLKRARVGTGGRDSDWHEGHGPEQ